ncbi:hypothetical protein ZIOFF_015530 [Zingiber officinale]|uniref:Uncharacterized protein n=1 Tax=Zingiber officinale TaxID=94328 RepID=A0A8J5LFD4_ZINOF|nr:hypothetical protein ZIOFF_015530 [Zingiber officinale]
MRCRDHVMSSDASLGTREVSIHVAVLGQRVWARHLARTTCASSCNVSGPVAELKQRVRAHSQARAKRLDWSLAHATRHGGKMAIATAVLGVAVTKGGELPLKALPQQRNEIGLCWKSFAGFISPVSSCSGDVKGRCGGDGKVICPLGLQKK